MEKFKEFNCTFDKLNRLKDRKNELIHEKFFKFLKKTENLKISDNKKDEI